MLRFGKLALVRLIKIPGGWNLKQASERERGREGRGGGGRRRQEGREKKERR